MRFPWVNTLLLVLVASQMGSGFLGLTHGQPDTAWLFELHRVGGYAILVILAWKGAVILGVFQRRVRWIGSRLAFLGLLFLLFAVLITGWVWALDGPLVLLGFSLLTIHILLAVGMFSLFAWHFWARRFVLNIPFSRDRRFVLRLGGASLAGLALSRGLEWGKGATGLAGAHRRFTGSYETGSETGQFPVVAWIADRPPRLDLNTWRLQISGLVSAPLHFDWQAIRALPQSRMVATLDCTGGWYTTQVWSGVSIGTLLESVGISPEARSLRFVSATGYRRSFPLSEARQTMLALSVAGQALSLGHGFPLRLVAPGYRGFNWVKWVVAVEVLETPAHWQAPLPLQ